MRWGNCICTSVSNLSATCQPPRWRQYLSVGLPRYSVAPPQLHFHSCVMPPSCHLHVRWGQRVDGLGSCLRLLVYLPTHFVGLSQFHCHDLAMPLHVHWGERVESLRLCLYLLIGPRKNSVGLPQLHRQNPVSSPLIFVVVHWTLGRGGLSLCP
jgi:hypothetical protein